MHYLAPQRDVILKKPDEFALKQCKGRIDYVKGHMAALVGFNVIDLPTKPKQKAEEQEQ